MYTHDKYNNEKLIHFVFISELSKSTRLSFNTQVNKILHKANIHTN